MIVPVPAIAAMAPYALADLDGRKVSLAQNEAFMPPSPAAIAAGERAVAQGSLYPDPDWTDLRAAIAEVHGFSGTDGLLIGAGSMELIAALLRAYAGPGDRVIGSAHGYLFVATACAQLSAVYETVPEVDYCVSVDALVQAAGHGPAPGIVFVCNPGNPTGTRLKTSEIIRLRDVLPPRTLLVVDQAYAEFDDQPDRPVFDLVDRGDTVILRTFSKAYALAGARVGWGLFPPRIAVEVRKCLNPNNVAAVSQAMAAAAVRDQHYMREKIVKPTVLQRVGILSVLRRYGFSPPESFTNFVLVPHAGPEAAEAGFRRLSAAGYLLRPMGGYGLAHCLRLTMGAPAHMAAVAELMKDGPDAR